jgi:murein DD-endopeptidase MepM/ murein hydrolase activator NlpD
MRVLPRLALVGLLATLIPAASAAPVAEPAEGSSVAAGVRVVSPGNGGSAAEVAAPPAASLSTGGFAYGDGAVSVGAMSTSAQAEGGSRATATATASVAGASLFGGEVQIGQISLSASASASASRVEGAADTSTVASLTAGGQAVAVGPNARVPLGDWGYAIVLEQAVVREDGEARGLRVSVVGVHVHLTADHGGLPAGTDILIGYAEAAARAPVSAALEPAPEPEATPTPRRPRPSKSSVPREPVPQPPGARPTPPPIVRNPPADVKPRLTPDRYVFPVYGVTWFGDDFAAARAEVGWHHGNDLFAPVGAPVLAVTDGALFLVGRNELGGNRLWLRDDAGNEFYYAHLSAYSPVAFDGSRVRAGDVVGFVGATGDAVGTPPHLHFEIHPAGLLGLGYDGVVNPYEYLTAWRRLEDASFDDGHAWRPTPGKAPPAAAVLLEAVDISEVGALDTAAVDALLAVPDLFGEGVSPVAEPDVLRR